MNYTTDEEVKVDFPVWILGAPKPIQDAADLTDGYLTLNEGDELLCTVFTDEQAAIAFLTASGAMGQFVPRKVTNPSHLDSLLEFYQTAHGAKRVFIARSGDRISKVAIDAFRAVNLGERRVQEKLPGDGE